MSWLVYSLFPGRNTRKTVGNTRKRLKNNLKTVGNARKTVRNARKRLENARKQQTNEIKVAQYVSKMIKPLNRHRKQCLEGFRKPDRHSG